MALPKPPGAVLLDVDETLIDGSGLVTSTVAVSREFAARHPELGLDPARLAHANGAAWQRNWIAHESAWIRGQLDDLGLSTMVWSDALRSLGVSDPVSLANEAAQEHGRALAAATHPFEDVVPALDALAEAGIPIGIVTNGSSSAQRAKVALLGTDRFAFVVVTGEHGIAKPDPRIFEIAVQGLALPAHRVVHVGDNLSADIGGAFAAGLGTVWLNRAGGPRPVDAPTPDAEITTLADLPRVLGVTSAPDERQRPTA